MALIYRRQRPGAVHSFGEAEIRGWQGSSITTSLLGISPVPSQVGQTSPSGHMPIPMHVGHLIIFITVITSIVAIHNLLSCPYLFVTRCSVLRGLERTRQKQLTLCQGALVE